MKHSTIGLYGDGKKDKPTIKKMNKVHKGIHRTCEPENIVGDAEFRTTDGESFIKIRH